MLSPHFRMVPSLGALIAAAAVLCPPPAGAGQKVASRFYYMDDTLASISLQAHYAQVGVLSPAWFTVELNGDLHSTADSKLITWAAQKKLPLTPVIANRDFKPEAVQAAVADANRDKLIADIARLGADAHFSGFELDFEEVPANSKAAFTGFVHQLAGALHKQKMTLGVAIPAPLTPASAWNAAAPEWSANPRAAAFDLKELAKSADSLTLMAYDEYTAVNEPGPVAGFPWVEACVRKTAGAVSSEKVLLGLALYYRHWNGSSVTEGPFPAARALAAKSGVKIVPNAMHKEMTFGFLEGAAKHTVWGEDASDLAARIELISKYKLGGFAAWRLGQEDPEVWQKVFHR